MDIFKLPMPEKINDEVLNCLPFRDHVKYTFFYHKYNKLLSESINCSAEEQAKIRYSVDWFHQINHLFTHYPRWFALGYIAYTYPLGEWTDYDLSTVKSFEYAYHKLIGNSIPDSFVDTFVSILNEEYKCLFCGRTVAGDEAVIKKGVPACGLCTKVPPRPFKVFLMAEFSSDYLNRYRDLSGRIIQASDTLRDSDFVHVFSVSDNVSPRCQSVMKDGVGMGIPVVSLEINNV